jgi:hypothetical protein
MVEDRPVSNKNLPGRVRGFSGQEKHPPRSGATFILPEEDLSSGTMATISLILCRIGLHRWGRKRGYDEYSSNVIEWEQRCERCGKRKRWVEAKRDRRR